MTIFGRHSTFDVVTFFCLPTFDVERGAFFWPSFEVERGVCFWPTFDQLFRHLISASRVRGVESSD